jgi:hypothetical protein
MGTTESKKENIVNENINLSSVSEKKNNDETNDIMKICLISLAVTLLTLVIVYKLRKLFKEQVQKFSITRV